MNLTLPSTRSWQDAFGTAILTLEGGTGGRVTLIVSPLETSREALDVVLQSRSFKGRLALAVLEDIRGTPVIHAIQTLEAKAVIVLDPHTHVAVAGPVVTLEPPSQGFPTSLEYAEPATLPGWNAGWMTERVQHLEPQENTSSVAASAAASLGVPSLVCGMDTLSNVLERIL